MKQSKKGFSLQWTLLLILVTLILIKTSKAELCTETWRPCIYDENNTLLECNTTDMNLMFYNINNWTEIGNISNWNTSCITNMALMFHNSNFDQDISNWDVSNVKNMYGMFFNVASFNQNISKWNVSNVTDMRYMFSGAVSFNQSLNDWDVSGVEDMSYMFSGAVSFNQPLDNWDVRNVESMEGMFKDAVMFNQSINMWIIENLKNMAYMFENATSFNQNLNLWDTSKVRYMINTFKNAVSFNGNISNRDTNELVNTNAMFFNAVSFNQPLYWNVGNVEDMCEMFSGAVSFNQPLNSWNTSKVWCVSAMFFNAKNFNQSLSNWDVSNVEDFSYMFACDIADCEYSFNGNVSSWNTSKAADMSAMFFNAKSFNQDISNWDVSRVESMNSMFFNAVSFNQNISKWNVSSLNDANNMFYNVTLPTDNYDSILTSWVNLELKYDVPFDAGNSKYTENAIDARERLTTNFNWTIFDDGQYIPCIENWPLENQACINNVFIKKYYDLNNCNTSYTLPDDNGTTQYCEYSTSKSDKTDSKNLEKKSEVCIYDENYDWKCSEWGECINGKQYRKCLEKNNCGTNYGRPKIEKECDSKKLSVGEENIINKYVKKDKALFDIILEILEEPYENQELPIKITLINFGKSGLINVNLTYIIYDENENIVFFEKKEYIVDTQKEFITQLPINIINGKYYLKVILEYPDQEYPALAQKDFIIKKKFNSGKILLISSSTMLLFFILYFFIFYHASNKFHLKNFIQRLKEIFSSGKDSSKNKETESSVNLKTHNLNENFVSEEKTTSKYSDKTIPDAPPGKEFFLKDKIIKNLKELLSELYLMDESCFKEYVNEQKNDFANWIRDVFERKDLAQKIADTHSKTDLIEVLKEYV